MQPTNIAPSWYVMAIYPAKQKSSASKAGRQAQGWAWMYCHTGQPLLPPALPMPTALWTCAWPWTYTGIAWREKETCNTEPDVKIVSYNFSKNRLTVTTICSILSTVKNNRKQDKAS